MKWLMILAPLVAGLGAALAFVLVVGALIPRKHTATRSARFVTAPQVAWEVITNFEGQPSWRPRLKRIERLADHDGRPVWREIDSWGQALPIEIVIFDAPTRMVGRIADESLPFGGTWTYEVTPEAGGCRVRITEDGIIRSALFRYIARAGGYTGTMERYLRALAMRLGERASIEP